MNKADYLDFFKKELTENLLSFWMGRCLDAKNGGYFNCFTNDGSRLVSSDKYIWSQGRFLWVLSKLSMIESDLFTPEQRAVFLRYAQSGKEFLLKNVLMAPGDYRCVFLTDAEGRPKQMEGHTGYDLSISADCFVVMGFAAYARAAGDVQAWDFCKNLGESVWERYNTEGFRSYPYPVPKGYASHAKPMILTNMLCEMYRTAQQLDKDYSRQLLPKIKVCHEEVFDVFTDENALVHEFTQADGSFTDDLFGQHINPGHTLEDMWFQCEAAEVLQDDSHKTQICEIVKRTMALGWDETYGGIYHFIPCDGLDTNYAPGAMVDEPQMKLVLDDWGSKLWWVHSEALYTTLLMFLETGDHTFEALFQKVFDYTYATFPNPDRNIREWIQIRTRQGRPKEKVVALPVKDPYHIIRNVILIIELLERQKDYE